MLYPPSLLLPPCENGLDILTPYGYAPSRRPYGVRTGYTRREEPDIDRADRPPRRHSEPRNGSCGRQGVRATAMDRPRRVDRAPRAASVHRWPPRAVAAEGGEVGDAAADYGRPPIREGARCHPRLCRGRPEPGDPGHERLGRP